MPKTEFSRAQKRKMAGYKSVISNPKSTAEAKAKAERSLAHLMNDAAFGTAGDRISNDERKAKGKAKDAGSPRTDESDEIQRGLNGLYIAIRGLHEGMHLANRAHRLVDRIADDPPNVRLEWMKRIWEAVSAAELMLLPDSARNEAVGRAYAKLEEERKEIEDARKEQDKRWEKVTGGNRARNEYEVEVVAPPSDRRILPCCRAELSGIGCPYCHAPLQIFQLDEDGPNELLRLGQTYGNTLSPFEDAGSGSLSEHANREAERQGVQEDSGGSPPKRSRADSGPFHHDTTLSDSDISELMRRITADQPGITCPGLSLEELRDSSCPETDLLEHMMRFH